ncbi:hypothetical protein Lal_00042574 [Lupinus albus]|nr:hypothetical protein Lal_00042574 [Lupinus albus]
MYQTMFQHEISSREDIPVLNSLTKALLLSPFYFLLGNSSNGKIEFLAIVIVPFTYQAETSYVACHRYITANRTKGFHIQNNVISLNMGSHEIFPKVHIAVKYVNKLGIDIVRFAAKVEIPNVTVRFCPYSELEVDGRSKCSKFESGLRPKLKRMSRHHEIVDFATLVNKCRMYEDDLKVDELATPKTISPGNYGPQRNHMWEVGKERVEDDRKPFAATTRRRDRNFQRSRPFTVPTEGSSHNVI